MPSALRRKDVSMTSAASKGGALRVQTPPRSAVANGIEPRAALATLPHGVWVLTAAHADRRAAALVDWVVPCGSDPALIGVVARKGHAVEPLIRDSHRFAVCQLDARDRSILRRFARAGTLEDWVDPFEGLEITRLVGGAPVLAASPIVFDCDVHRHLDIESDQELYVGLVLAGRVPGYTIIPQHPPDEPSPRE